MNNVILHLEEHGVKPSLQRIAIMEYLATHKTHPTAEDIYLDLVQTMPTLSRTTVYNTLKLFAQKGAALSLNIDDKNIHYDGDVSVHAHFRCLKCGAILDIFPQQVGQILDICIQSVGDITITETQVYYKGYCNNCKNQQHNTTE